MRILEEFWYGNIEPTEYDTSSNKAYKKLVELIFRNEEKLRATMTDEQKELFEKYTDCVWENQVITDCLIFQNGFKLGASNFEQRFQRNTSCCAGSFHLRQEVYTFTDLLSEDFLGVPRFLSVVCYFQSKCNITLWILGSHTVTSFLNMLSRKEVNYN